MTGPVTGGAGKPVTAAPLDLASYGYVEEEYFLEGDATAYDWKGPQGEDGVWSVKTTTTAHYKTRILVRRPSDASKFNGTVLVEWLNDTGGQDADPDFGYGHAELLRSGFAYVGVSAQSVGVLGGGILDRRRRRAPHQGGSPALRLAEAPGRRLRVRHLHAGRRGSSGTPARWIPWAA